jgi:small GTP-binding protein
MIGDTCVGKTSFLLQTSHDDDTAVVPTVAPSSFYYERQVGSKATGSFQIWDTAGQDAFTNMTAVYLREASGVIYVFDVTSRASFDNLSRWHQIVTDTVYPDFSVVLGNKCDLEDARCVRPEEGITWAVDHKAEYFDVSATAGTRTEDVICHCAKEVVAAIERRTLDFKPITPLPIDGPNDVAPRKCCK